MFERFYAQKDNGPDTPISFEEMPLQKFAGVVNEAAKSNSEKQTDAIARADSYSFRIAHPELMDTTNNKRLFDHWLRVNGRFEQPTYPDFEAAYNHYRTTDLLDLDAAELARDSNAPKSYRGVYTQQTFYSVSEMIGAERQAALAQMPKASDIEKALESLPIDQAQALLREAERAEQALINAPAVQFTADAWLLLHPEFIDSTQNAKFLTQQLQANKDSATMAGFEKAAGQLRESGLLRLKKSELDKQHQAELQQTADEARKSLFDKTSEAEMYRLPLDEIRRRANGNFSGSGV